MKTEVAADVESLKSTLENTEAGADDIQAAVSKLGESSQKMGAAMYAAAEADQAAARWRYRGHRRAGRRRRGRRDRRRADRGRERRGRGQVTPEPNSDAGEEPFETPASRAPQEPRRRGRSTLDDETVEGAKTLEAPPDEAAELKAPRRRADRRPAAPAGGVRQLQAPRRPRPRPGARECDVHRAHPDHRRARRRSTGRASTISSSGGFKAVAELAGADRLRGGPDQVRRGRRRVRPDHPRGALATSARTPRWR